ncbi:glycosyltransferase [Clostridium perfringens]|uniref:glycosyltransferase n=1 Tax=Clostridium perfringens TaxID=1502 RepID=UPI0039E8ED6B
METKKIRVIHFLSNISISSGVASVIMNYYRYIEREKVQFDFIYFEDADVTYEKDIREMGGEIYKVSRPSINSRFFKEIKSIFNKYEKDNTIFHNHETYMNIFLYRIVREFQFKANIVHSHTTKYSDKFINSIRNKILCWGISKKADCLIACSKAAGKVYYGNKNLRNNKVFILNNAINYDKFKYNNKIRMDVRKELNIENSFVIGHVGRFNNQKNHKFIINLFNEVLKKKNDCKLLLIGEGPLLDSIKNMSENMNINKNIIFLGRRKDVNNLLQAMDCFILPSLYEGLPVIGVEAQCAGLPCIMSDNITYEVNIGACEFLNLDDDINKWVNSVINKEFFKRFDSIENLKNNGFDIKQESLRLEEFYINLI